MRTALLLLILLVGCIDQPTVTTTTELKTDPGIVESTNISCDLDSECTTPGEYLILSHCRYYSKCVDKYCAVICDWASDFKDMTLDEARIIAEKSDCTKDANLTKKAVYNRVTKTWWIDLDLKKEGCSPACVVIEETSSARINWRCTGRIPPTDEKFCGYSSKGPCNKNKDCLTGGCSGQVCHSNTEKMAITTCEYRECYDERKYGLSCKCVDGECMWSS